MGMGRQGISILQVIIEYFRQCFVNANSGEGVFVNKDLQGGLASPDRVLLRYGPLQTDKRT